MSMREAGLHVQPNISRFSVASIVRTFREHNRIERLPHAGGRRGIFSQQQETIIVNMVLQNNLIRLREIQQRVEEDNENFEGINSVSLSTIDRVLKRNLISLKQAYRVPFERNSERVKELRYQYVQEALLRREERGDEQAENPVYLVIWDNVNFHRGPRIREWFENNPRFINVCLPPYSPSLNPIEDFFSAWKWKVYDRTPYA
ncbi:uncharacterized protein LOC119778035 [Cyprinodon tularosa]|uniref:uncharacterized protein LOC119778035 n=1 Tax=Cyprinodon tularosa TaxID=77115 RepID=UPI0018E257EC|nr:uncharacterized protein LOC119778035 [Cyprinodon tularosa]